MIRASPNWDFAEVSENCTERQRVLYLAMTSSHEWFEHFGLRGTNITRSRVEQVLGVVLHTIPLRVSYHPGRKMQFALSKIVEIVNESLQLTVAEIGKGAPLITKN